MGYPDDAATKLHEQTRAVLCHGYRISRSSEAIGDALSRWVSERAERAGGDMSLQLIAHGEDFACSDWRDAPFLVGVCLREVFGLDGDHRLGLGDDELIDRQTRADVELAALLPALRSQVNSLGCGLSDRGLFLSWTGPLCGAKLVKGVWHDEIDEDRHSTLQPEGTPAFFTCRAGASQDDAPGGVLGLPIEEHWYGGGEPPILTAESLGSVDEALARAGVHAAKLFVFSHYD